MNDLAKRESAKNNRILFLDYLRVFAFLSVLIAHKYSESLSIAANDMNVHATLRLMALTLYQVFEGGGVGVIVFFLISGYIITCVARREGVNTFVVRRFFRIYPLYAFAVMIEIVLDTFIKGVPVPPLSIILPRITLMGDFFGTPYALGSVEWTLRVEIYFYIVTAVLLKMGAFNHPKALPFIYAIIIASLQYFGPFNQVYGWSNGYISMYMPFLFVGSCIYLYEKNIANRYVIFLIGVYTWLSYLISMPYINITLYKSHFVTVAVILFLAAWIYRRGFKNVTWVVFLSELTYSIYIFHNWMMNYFMDLAALIGLSVIQSNIFSLCFLFVFCTSVHFCVEKFFISIGKRIITSMKSHKYGVSRKITADGKELETVR